MSSSASSGSERRKGSITAEELTPIVLSQLQTATKAKEESRRQRREGKSSQSPGGGVKTGAVITRSSNNPGGSVSAHGAEGAQQVLDSGSESCGEESRMRTAEAFMSGIQSALSASVQDLSGRSDGAGGADGGSTPEAACLSDELVSEVDSVLSRLMSSVNKGDPSLVPLITNLQASLKERSGPASKKKSPSSCVSDKTTATSMPSPSKLNISSPAAAASETVAPSSSSSAMSPSTPSSAGSQKEWLKDPFGSLPKRPAAQEAKQDFEPVIAKTFDPRNKSIGGALEETRVVAAAASGGASSETHVASKIPWKIRAARKRQMKHHTTGMTKDEFAQIQQSLRESAAKCKEQGQEQQYQYQHHQRHLMSRSSGSINKLIERFSSFSSSSVSPHPVESYSLVRNKSESAIRSQLRHGREEEEEGAQGGSGGGASSGVGGATAPARPMMPSSYRQPEGNRAYTEVAKSVDSLYKSSDLGYASDVCDYNVAAKQTAAAGAAATSAGQGGRGIQKDMSYVQQKRPASMVSQGVKPMSPLLESSLYDRRKKLIQKRAKIFMDKDKDGNNSSSCNDDQTNDNTSHDNVIADDNADDASNDNNNIIIGDNDHNASSTLIILENDCFEPRVGRNNPDLSPHHAGSDNVINSNIVHMDNSNSINIHDNSYSTSNNMHPSSCFNQNPASPLLQYSSSSSFSDNNHTKYPDNDLLSSSLQTGDPPVAAAAAAGEAQQLLQVPGGERPAAGGDQLQRQSSAEDDPSAKGHAKVGRKNSKASTSAVKAKIARRKMMRQANAMDNALGSLSDQEATSEANDDEDDSVEEKQDSEPINEKNLLKPQAVNSSMMELTPETARKNWSSRFSNIKSSFNAASEEDISKSRSPSINRLSDNPPPPPVLQSSPEIQRGRGRARESRASNIRSQSAHNIKVKPILTVSSSQEDIIPEVQPEMVGRSTPGSSERAKSKEDKNKLNTLTANSVSSIKGYSSDTPPGMQHQHHHHQAPPPSGRDSVDYHQYVEMIERFRGNNPKAYSRPLQKNVPTVPNSKVQKKDSLGAPANVHGESLQQQQQQQQLGPQRISKSQPREHTADQQSRAEFMGLVKSSRSSADHPGSVVSVGGGGGGVGGGMGAGSHKNHDMDYQEYMNIINKVRRTKEFTRVRTEQIRLASMYAQEKKRQEELKLEEERLKQEREKIEREREEARRRPPPVTATLSLDSNRKSLHEFEKGQLDNNESEVSKISPNMSPSRSIVLTSSNGSGSGNGESGGVNKEFEQPRLERTNSNDSTRSTERKRQEQARLEQIRLEQLEQKRQQELRELQVKAEQEKLLKLREEQIKQEKEREEIRRLEFERLQQIQEEQRRLEFERKRQEESIRQEQLRLEEERKRHEKLQAEKNAQYNRQRLDIEAQNFALNEDQMMRERMRTVEREAVVNIDTMSPEERIIRERLAQQDKLREEHRKEETQIRQEKLNLLKQEEMLINRQASGLTVSDRRLVASFPLLHVFPSLTTICSTSSPKWVHIWAR